LRVESNKQTELNMRVVTEKIVGAFLNRKAKTVGNTSTDGNSLWLHGNQIAQWDGDGRPGLWIRNCGWFSSTTKERLNGLPNVSIWQKQGEWFLNGAKWDGTWAKVG
jgi:hypothetical protein